uniref:NADH-ubiquinone oxidoreductase chain 5 n=1 Tax=Cantharellus lutescens TaxID=104198 RepID=A0A2S0S4G4_9AGAM|nr:NADH dehydrogenase subunit 5 [Cantharellus lutescens]AWA82231.1 NADH dehydrogenase subunit 5 [Cantharellus lutescens]
MYLSILMLPLLGSIVSGLLGRKIGVTGSHIVTITCLIITSSLSIIAFYEVGVCDSPVSIHITSWVNSEFLNISWGFLFDSLTVSMLIPVLFISTLVHIYSTNYMAEDPHNQRFFSYLSLFTFFMIVLVTGENYLVLFLGWEGIGVVSYLLINFWYTRIAANKSGILALTQNRVGDALFSLGLFSIFWVFGNLDYSTIFSLVPYINEISLTIISFLLLGGAIVKSAQLGTTWLPWSMEGPTPVSALLHAATLVTAGIYLLVRSSPLLEYSPTALLFIIWLGALTSFFAASTGLLQNDMKRIIAFSTVSQLGYMFMAIGLSQYNVALFHMVNHAFFKALLFLAAGAVIHSMADQQDIRKLGGLQKFLPFTYTAILIGSISLMALPWMTGFYSKDLIIELAYAQYQFSGQIAYWLGTLTAIFTAFYSFRLISLVFLSYPNAPKNDYLHSHEASSAVVIPLTILSLFSIFFGFVFSDLFVGIGTDFFGNSIFTHPTHITLVEAEFSLPLLLKLLPTIGSIFAAISAILLYNNIPNVLIDLTDSPSALTNSISNIRGNLGIRLYTFLNGKYLLDVVYNKYTTGAGLKLGYTVSKVLDRGIIELVGPFGISKLLMNTAANISRLDTGIVTSYALYIVLGLISILFILFYPVIVNSTLLSYDQLLNNSYITEMRLIIIFISALFILNTKSIDSN